MSKPSLPPETSSAYKNKDNRIIGNLSKWWDFAKNIIFQRTFGKEKLDLHSFQFLSLCQSEERDSFQGKQIQFVF